MSDIWEQNIKKNPEKNKIINLMPVLYRKFSKCHYIASSKKSYSTEVIL